MGIPNHGRGWEDVDIFLRYLALPEYNNREINYTLLMELTDIIKKESAHKYEEEYDLAHEWFPTTKCGNLGDLFKIKDGHEKLILVKVIEYHRKNCVVIDVYSNIEAIVDHDILDKRAKNMTDDEIVKMTSIVIPKFGGAIIYPAGYRRLDALGR